MPLKILNRCRKNSKIKKESKLKASSPQQFLTETTLWPTWKIHTFSRSSQPMIARTTSRVLSKEWSNPACTRLPKQSVTTSLKVVERRVRLSEIFSSTSRRLRSLYSRKSLRSPIASRRHLLRSSTKCKAWSTSSMRFAPWFSSKKSQSTTRTNLTTSTNRWWKCKRKCRRTMKRPWRS